MSTMALLWFQGISFTETPIGEIGWTWVVIVLLLIWLAYLVKRIFGDTL